MDYRLTDLVDISKLQAILDELYSITELPSAIFDLQGNNLTDSGWQELCLRFYKANETTSSMCTVSNVGLIEKVIQGKSYVVSNCPFGITNIGSPIIIEDKPIAVITIGQFFIEKPNTDFYLKHIEQYHFDEKSFVKSFREMPVISLKKAMSVADFVERFAGIIAEMGLSNLKLKRNEEIISKTNAELEKLVNERTQELIQINEFDRLKTEFLANISHELRTPINIIYCSLQMLDMYIKNEATDNTSKMKRHINMMKQNSFRLIRLIDNLIDITKIDSGNFKINLVNSDIIQIIDNITQSVAEYARSKGLDLSFHTNAASVILACDPDKMERIILNLLSNSIKFTPAPGSIAVKLHCMEDQLVITVKDTGIGIPQKKIHTVFERFSQLDTSLSRHQEGSGIGLSLVKSLVEMHQGRIHINSDYKDGCEMIIRLPIIKLPESQSVGKESHNMGNIERIMIEFSDIYDYNS